MPVLSLSKKRSIVWLGVLGVLAGLWFARGPHDAPYAERRGFAMGTAVAIRARCEAPVLDEAFARLCSLDALLSAHVETSEIGRVNARAGEAMTLSSGTAALVRRALGWATRTDGAFDPTLRPLTRLWPGDGERHRPPASVDVAAALPHVGWRRAQLGGDILRLEPRMGLDLGGIAKGHAADEIAAFLRERGIASALVDLGGNVVAVGERPAGGSWRVGIQDPRGARGACLGVVEVRDLSVVTSGNYERFFEWEGRRYGHILDPATGEPATSDLLSVTVVSRRSADGDALATALFVLGRERAKRLARILEGEGFSFILVGEDGGIYLSPALQGVFRLESPEYRLEAGG